MFSIIALAFSSCSKEKVSLREYEGVKIAGVKVNDELFTPTHIDDVTQIIIPAGRDLSKLKLNLLVINGEATNFNEDAIYDCRKPLIINLKGKDGQNREVTLKVLSPPALSTFIIEGLNIPQEDIHFSASSLIVQV